MSLHVAWLSESQPARNRLDTGTPGESYFTRRGVKRKANKMIIVHTYIQRRGLTPLFPGLVNPKHSHPKVGYNTPLHMRTYVLLCRLSQHQIKTVSFKAHLSSWPDKTRDDAVEEHLPALSRAAR